MKDKLLFGTIGLLVGIVVMQWTMPLGSASVVTPPVGGVVAAEGGAVLMTDGSIWLLDSRADGTRWWHRISDLSMPIGQVQFFLGNGALVDKNGDTWAIGPTEGDPWLNYGQPPVAPLANNQSTWGKVKAKFSGNGDKQ